MITFNRQLKGCPGEKRAKLEAKILAAQAELEAFDKAEARIERWLKLLEESLVHHWIDNPEKYMKEWYEKNPE